MISSLRRFKDDMKQLRPRSVVSELEIMISPMDIIECFHYGGNREATWESTTQETGEEIKKSISGEAAHENEPRLAKMSCQVGRRFNPITPI